MYETVNNLYGTGMEKVGEWRLPVSLSTFLYYFTVSKEVHNNFT